MNKNVIYAVLLVAVVALAVIWGVRRTIGRQGPPDAVLQEVVKKIDYKTREIIPLSQARWEELRDKTPRANVYKNPKTGEYTVVNILTCGHCGAEIPTIAITDEVAANGDVRKLRDEYKCPFCGQSAFFR